MRILLVVLMCVSSSVFAREFYLGAQSLSLAGTGRAGLESAQAALINPSLVALSNSEILLTYVDGAPAEHGQITNFGVTAVEADLENVSNGALSYRNLRRSGPGLNSPVSGELWHGALGKVIHPRLAMGASVYRLTYATSGQDIPEQWNGSFGLTFLATQNLGLAYVLDSPFGVNDRIPLLLREGLAHSAALFYKPVENSRFRMDLSKREFNNPSDNLDLGVSFELKSREYIILRFGHKWEGSTGENKLGAGFGFSGPRLKVDYGFQQNLAFSESMHSVDLRITF